MNDRVYFSISLLGGQYVVSEIKGGGEGQLKQPLLLLSLHS